MAEDKKGLSDDQMRDSIAMFEQILEVMPQDQLALRALYDIYNSADEMERALDCLNRLADVVDSEKDIESVQFILEQYTELGELAETPDAQKRVEKLREMGVAPGSTEGVMPEGMAEADDEDNPELAMAWNLFQADQISQDDYSNVLNDLTEMTSRNVDVPVTVLHVLHDRSYTHFTRVMTYLCKQTSTPIISLADFDPPEEISSLLPIKFSSKRGGIVFSGIGNELLVGVLNPYDGKLKRDIEQITRRKCHTFLVAPDEYDQLLANMRSKGGG